MGNWGELTIFLKGTSLFQNHLFGYPYECSGGVMPMAYDKSMGYPWDVGLVYYPT